MLCSGLESVHVPLCVCVPKGTHSSVCARHILFRRETRRKKDAEARAKQQEKEAELRKWWEAQQQQLERDKQLMQQINAECKLTPSRARTPARPTSRFVCVCVCVCVFMEGNVPVTVYYRCAMSMPVPLRCVCRATGPWVPRLTPPRS